MTAWSRITWKFLSNFCVFWKTTSYGKIFKILRRKFTRRHQSTLLGSNVVKSVLREIGEIGRYSHDKKSASSQTVATALITPKMFRCQHATFGSDCSKMHPNRFTFGGVIVECVNTVLLTRSALADPKGAGGGPCPPRRVGKHPECTKSRHFQTQNQKKFLGRGQCPLPRPQLVFLCINLITT